MSTSDNYKLINRQNREIKLRESRRDILAADSGKALELILGSSSPAALIQSFPDQDLYYLMHKIGVYDFIPVLSMAASDQWEYILDVEVWDNDRLDTRYMTKVFDVLFKAGDQRLLRWAVTEKPDFFEFYLAKHLQVVVREHDEPPPADADDYITIDDKFYFRFTSQSQPATDKPLLKDSLEEDPADRSEVEAQELIEKMLKLTAEMDISVFHGLLLETQSLLPAEVEEEQFRLKNLRLAEKGFLPSHEAIGIYQPAALDTLRKRPVPLSDEKALFDPDIPLPPQFFSGFLKGDNLFVKSLQLFDPSAALTLESEMAALINKVISADKIKPRAKKEVESAIAKTCDYINLGLEIILKWQSTPQAACDVINIYFLEDIFRTGSRAGIQLKTKAVNWFKHSFTNRRNLPLSFLGEQFLGVIGGLFLDRPMYFDNYASGKLYKNFSSMDDISQTDHVLTRIMAADHFLNTLDVDTKTFTHGVLTYKTIILTCWAKKRMDLACDLSPVPVDRFRAFFKELFPKQKTVSRQNLALSDLILWASEISDMNEKTVSDALVEVFTDLVRELSDEYERVDVDHIDPRFITHFLLKK